MNLMVENAVKAIEKPEVQDMIKRLSEYGLGVFMPHMHTKTEAFAPLPKGMVQVESDLKVSFHHESEAIISQSEPVGWAWDETTKTVMRCFVCNVRNDIHYSDEHPN